MVYIFYSKGQKLQLTLYLSIIEHTAFSRSELLCTRRADLQTRTSRRALGRKLPVKALEKGSVGSKIGRNRAEHAGISSPACIDQLSFEQLEGYPAIFKLQW